MIDKYIYEYEEILLGKKSRFVSSFKKGNTEKENRKVAGIIWRYAVTNLLHWTPREAVVNMTADIVNKLCLDKTYGAIGFDKSSYIHDYAFILQYAFPDEVKYDIKQETIDEYERVSKTGKWANDETPYKYQKKFFFDEKGIERAKILLSHVVYLYMGGMSLEKKYEFFSNRKETMKWLKKKHLDLPCKNVYLGNTLDYFHDAVHYNTPDYFLYYMNMARLKYEEIKNAG